MILEILFIGFIFYILYQQFMLHEGREMQVDVTQAEKSINRQSHYSKHDYTNRSKIIRKSWKEAEGNMASKFSDQIDNRIELSCPHYWGKRSLNIDYEEISLSPESVEFIIISRLVNDTIRSHGSGLGTINGKDPSRFIVSNIRRIHNRLVWEEYCFRKRIVIKTNNNSIKNADSSIYMKKHPFVTPLIDENANEYWLFHGCSKTTLDILTHKGYDNRISSVDGMFGGGFYLAENSSKANQYISCPQCGNNSISSKGKCTCLGQENIIYSILMYRAVLGDIHVVQKYDNKYKTNDKGPVRRPPMKNVKGDVYDSVLGESRQYGGNSLNYREVVLYESGQAYPEYIIDFKRSLQPQTSSNLGKSALDECYGFLHRNPFR